MAKVVIPALLRSLTGGVAEMHAAGSTLREVVADLERQEPRLANRVADAAGILPEIMMVVDGVEARTIDDPVSADSEVLILPAIQGG